MVDDPQKEQDRPLSPPSLEERMKKVEGGFQELLKENHVTAIISPVFAQYKILPVEVQLALTILRKHEVGYKFVYKERTNNANVS